MEKLFSGPMENPAKLSGRGSCKLYTKGSLLQQGFSIVITFRKRDYFPDASAAPGRYQTAFAFGKAAGNWYGHPAQKNPVLLITPVGSTEIQCGRVPGSAFWRAAGSWYKQTGCLLQHCFCQFLFPACYGCFSSK